MKKKDLFLAAILVFVLGSAGCTIDSRYLSEKLLWKAQKEHARIIKDAKGKLSAADYEKIINAYRRVVERVPLEKAAADAEFIIAGIYFVRGDYARARKELRNVINNFSSQPKIAAQAYFSIGRVFEKEGKWKEARNQYEQIVELYPFTAIGLRMPLYILAHYQKEKDAEGAEKAYRWGVRKYSAILKEYKGTSLAPVVIDYVARLHLQKGNVKDAVARWDSIVSEYTNTPFAAQALLTKAGVLATKLKDRKGAVEALEEFLKRFPRSRLTGEVKVRLAGLYFNEGDIDRAKEIFSQVAADKKNKSGVRLNAYLGLSYCYRKESDTGRLLALYVKIKKEFPDTKAALSVPFLIGQYYEQQNMASAADTAFGKAVKYYRELLSAKNDKIDAHYVANLLALCYLKKNEVKKAEDLLRQLADKYPSDPVYLFDLARLYLNLNAKDKAIGVYKELMAKYPDNRLIQQVAGLQIKRINTGKK